MKKNLFYTVLIFLVLMTRPGYAQYTFAPVGAEWWYGGNNFDYAWFQDVYENWADHLQSVKDTIVAGIPCRQLTAVRYGKSNVSLESANTATIRYRDTFYIYNTGDTVFVYDKAISNYTPLYIFNVAVGDTLSLRKPNYSGNDARFYIVIDSIKSEPYDTAWLKSYYYHNILDTGFIRFSWGGPLFTPGGPRSIGKYTERIGGNWPKLGSFFPNAVAFNPDFYKISNEIPTGSFRCYYDPGTAIKMTGISCDSVFSLFVNIADIKKSDYDISVYPNPAASSLRIIAGKPLPEAIALQLTDLAGRVLEQGTLPRQSASLTIDVRHYAEGVYFLKLRMKEGQFYRKIIIRH